MNDTARFPDTDYGQAVETATHFETISYIAHMLEQLSLMAKNRNYEVLAYMIEIAQIEAREVLENEARR